VQVHSLNNICRYFIRLLLMLAKMYIIIFTSETYLSVNELNYNIINKVLKFAVFSFKLKFFTCFLISIRSMLNNTGFGGGKWEEKRMT
jgi:hypothetical protein